MFSTYFFILFSPTIVKPVKPERANYVFALLEALLIHVVNVDGLSVSRMFLLAIRTMGIVGTVFTLGSTSNFLDLLPA